LKTTIKITPPRWKVCLPWDVLRPPRWSEKTQTRIQNTENNPMERLRKVIVSAVVVGTIWILLIEGLFWLVTEVLKPDINVNQLREFTTMAQHISIVLVVVIVIAMFLRYRDLREALNFRLKYYLRISLSLIVILAVIAIAIIVIIAILKADIMGVIDSIMVSIFDSLMMPLE
jgi:magnesium-transporting ATPase (P-type)